jgi:O-methyltransferase involved in polyketide biosynthesis
LENEIEKELILMKNQLTGIPETLLIPLWARAYETELEESIIKDYHAVDMVSQIDYDFRKFEKSRLSQLGVCVRTLILDNAIHQYLRSHPEAVVINLGAGLDGRAERLRYDNYKCWYDLDMPETISMRKQFFQENEHMKMIPCSMFDYSWFDAVDYHNEPILIIAEGLFMYFEEQQIKDLFRPLIDHFPNAELLIEMIPPIMVGKAKHHDSLKTMEVPPEFKWAIKNSREIETWDRRIQLIKEWSYYNYSKKRWKLFGFIARLPFLRSMMNCRISHLRFRENI